MVVIFVVALLVLGPKKLPEVARFLGKGLAEFRRASAELRGSLEREMQNIEHEVKQQEAAKQPPAQTPVTPAAATPETGTPVETAGLDYGAHEPDPYNSHYHDYNPEAPHDEHEFQR